MLKKITKIMFSCFMILFLVACSDKSVIISEAELTEYESSLTDMLSEQHFAYDLDVQDKNISETTIGIDLYQNSKLVKRISEASYLMEEEDRNDPLRLVFLLTKQDKKNGNWLSAVMTASGNSSFISDFGVDTMSYDSNVGAGVLNQTPIELGKEHVISSVVYSNKDSVSVGSEIETEEDLKRVTNYEQVFIIKLKVR